MSQEQFTRDTLEGLKLSGMVELFHDARRIVDHSPNMTAVDLISILGTLIEEHACLEYDDLDKE